MSRKIEHVKADLENAYAGLWIVDKRNRLAAYQQSVEIADSEIAKALDGRLGISTTDAEGNETWERVEDLSDILGRLERLRHRAVRSVAEELGQLPSRVMLAVEDAAKVRHILEGVDVDKL